MPELLAHPMVQAALAPLAVALAVAAALWRTPLAWLAVVAAYATAVALSAGFGFDPLTAGRKATLLMLVAPLAGVALDRLDAAGRGQRALPWVAAAVAAATAPWVFASVLAQREGVVMVAGALGLAAVVFVQTAAMLRLRDDGAAGGAAGVAAGFAVGIAALLSASIGYLIGGVAVAAGAGALLLLQFVLGRRHAPGYVGMLPLGGGLALFACGTTMLAQLPWYALPLLWLVPLAAAVGRRRAAPTPAADSPAALRAALVVDGVRAVIGAAPFVAVAWFAASRTAS